MSSRKDMHRFVHGKENGFNDLRENVSGAIPSSAKHTEVISREQRRWREIAANEEPGVDDTDPSSERAHRNQGFAVGEGVESLVSEDNTGSGSDEEDGSEVEDDPETIPNPAHFGPDQAHLYQMAHQRDPESITRHMPGDSLPSTTSGALSQADQAEARHGLQFLQQQRQPQQQRATLPLNAEQEMGWSNAYSETPPHRQADQQRRPTTSRGQADRRQDRLAVHDHSTAQHQASLPRRDPLPHNRHSNSSRMELPSQNTAERGSAPTSRTQFKEQYARPQQHAAMRQQQTQSPTTTAPRGMPVVPQTAIHSEPGSVDQGSEDQEPNANHSGDEDYNQLDHDLEELYNMDLQQLQDEPFDKDPRSGNFQLAQDAHDGSLPSKLSAVANVQAGRKAEFFASLSIEEWEEAGDWFLGKFGDCLSQLKEGRQQRRTVAKEFEAEIAKRHNAVSKKRKQTENDLNVMKESGGKVLEGTPRKAKKAR